MKEPATLCVLVNVKKLFTVASNAQEVPPKGRTMLELAVAATPPDQKTPVPIIVEFAPEAPIVRTTHDERRYQGPDSDETGVVRVIEVPNVVPGADVPRPGETISVPEAPVVIKPPASIT